MILLFIGPSGSGKDTQAEILNKEMNFTIISTGELLRQEVASGSDLGKEISKTLNEGKWSPDSIVYELVNKFILDSKSKNYILTGAVRRVSQVEILDETLNKINKKIDKVIYFDLQEDAAIERLSERLIDPETGYVYHPRFNPAPEGVKLIKRKDDEPDAIRSRLKEFRDTVEPIVNEYKRRDIIVSINASKSIEELSKEIKNIIESINE